MQLVSDNLSSHPIETLIVRNVNLWVLIECLKGPLGHLVAVVRIEIDYAFPIHETTGPSVNVINGGCLNTAMEKLCRISEVVERMWYNEGLCPSPRRCYKFVFITVKLQVNLPNRIRHRLCACLDDPYSI